CLEYSSVWNIHGEEGENVLSSGTCLRTQRSRVVPLSGRGVTGVCATENRRVGLTETTARFAKLPRRALRAVHDHLGQVGIVGELDAVSNPAGCGASTSASCPHSSQRPEWYVRRLVSFTAPHAAADRRATDRRGDRSRSRPPPRPARRTDPRIIPRGAQAWSRLTSLSSRVRVPRKSETRSEPFGWYPAAA